MAIKSKLIKKKNIEIRKFTKQMLREWGKLFKTLDKFSKRYPREFERNTSDAGEFLEKLGGMF